MKKDIVSIIEKVGCVIQPNLVDAQSENIISFSKNIQGKDFTFFLIYAKEEEMLIINLMHTYNSQYEKMEVDFYEVINKLNETCIHGYLGFISRDKTQIVYKASFIGDSNMLAGNNSFEYFFLVSFDMVDYFHSKLN